MAWGQTGRHESSTGKGVAGTPGRSEKPGASPAAQRRRGAEGWAGR